MKTILLVAISAAFIGCSKQDRAMNDSSGANADNAVEAQKETIDTAAKEAKDQIKADAKAQEEKIEAQAKSAKAELDAEKARAEADAQAKAKDIDGQSQKIEEAAGAATKQEINAAATQEANAEIQQKQADAQEKQAEANRKQAEAQQEQSQPQAIQTDANVQAQAVANKPAGDNAFRTALGLGDDKKDIEVHVENGKATLKGNVASEAEKLDLEAKAKAFPGVTSVENKLQVK